MTRADLFRLLLVATDAPGSLFDHAEVSRWPKRALDDLLRSHLSAPLNWPHCALSPLRRRSRRDRHGCRVGGRHGEAALLHLLPRIAQGRDRRSDVPWLGCRSRRPGAPGIGPAVSAPKPVVPGVSGGWVGCSCVTPRARSFAVRLAETTRMH